MSVSSRVALRRRGARLRQASVSFCRLGPQTRRPQPQRHSAHRGATDSRPSGDSLSAGLHRWAPPVPGRSTNRPTRFTACWPTSSPPTGPPRLVAKAARSTSGSRHLEPTTTGATPSAWPPSPPAFQAQPPQRRQNPLHRQQAISRKAPQAHHGRTASRSIGQTQSGVIPLRPCLRRGNPR